MPSHRFRIGDKVRLVEPGPTNSLEAFLSMVTTIDVTRSRDDWEVTRLLPADESGFQYHLRGDENEPERVVHERQLQLA